MCYNNAMDKMKKCSGCHIVKPINVFRYRKGTQDKYHSQCRECEAAYQRKHYAANIERERKRKRLWMAKARQDPEKRERMNAARRGNKKYASRQKDYIRKLKNEHFFIWRARNWSTGHSTKTTAIDLWNLWKMQRGLCALSGRKLNATAHLDHVIPSSSGGGHHISNLRWLDPIVNVARGNMSDSEFMVLCHQVINHNSK